MLILLIFRKKNKSYFSCCLFLEDIKFVKAPENQSPVIGTDYTVQCEVQADPPPIINWERDGVPITTKDRYVVDTKGLIIKNVRESDDGVYTCRAVVLSTGHLQHKNIRVKIIGNFP